MDTLGKRIAKLRKDNNLTQDKLMKILDFDNLSKYEKDLREPNFTILKSIARYFDVTTDYLLCLDEEPKRVSFVKEDNEKYPSIKITHDEENLLKLFRQLREKDQIKIEGMIELKIFESQELENTITEDICDNENTCESDEI
ncbi:helix-turn-helix domain-containing protein [Metaclostridioides mangenotii]|uniref:Transcriptional regulator with XRE-family HTH domain n=1 Tax=Metaclostridioides mangenotii TaxID=1540 RepID=A0ABS4E904_9FIRM|nr:helix-turn-helix transcriptional regulator [Clostridioides mangenotii]MBP1854420.1 transcriptional regulator with XRE-family HTH domain [Clostridioides mangenotii]